MAGVLVALLGVLLVALWWKVDQLGHVGEARHSLEQDLVGTAQASLPTSTHRSPEVGSAPPPLAPAPLVLADAPAVALDGAGGTASVLLRNWLMHLHPDTRNVWSEVARAFLDAVVSNGHVAEYFAEDDAALRTHFLAALMAVTSAGVTVQSLEALQGVHRRVRNSRGQPITAAVFESVFSILIEVLRTQQVPERTLQEVALVLLWLRQGIAAPSDDGR